MLWLPAPTSCDFAVRPDLGPSWLANGFEANRSEYQPSDFDHQAHSSKRMIPQSSSTMTADGRAHWKDGCRTAPLLRRRVRTERGTNTGRADPVAGIKGDLACDADARGEFAGSC